MSKIMLSSENCNEQIFPFSSGNFYSDSVRYCTSLAFHVLDHGDHCLESSIVDHLSIISHDLPPLPQPKCFLYLKRNFSFLLIISPSSAMIFHPFLNPSAFFT